MKRKIAHFSHHKAGTGWFYTILRSFALKAGLKFQQSSQKNLKEDTDVWFNWDPRDVDFAKLKNYRASHMIRDPRDVVVSAYFYHLWTEEEWCREPSKWYGGKSYQEIINSLSKNEGILFEMNGTSKDVIQNMRNWDYKNPNILEIKYEEYLLNQSKFNDLFDWYGLNSQEREIALKIADERSFKNLSKRTLGVEQKRSHLRKGTPGDWKNHFTKKHKEEFKRIFGDVAVQLGYEKNNNW